MADAPGSPRRDGGKAPTAGGKFGLVIPDIGEKQRVLFGRRARVAQGLDQPIDAGCLLVGGA